MNAESPSRALEQKSAEQLARLFSVAFSSAALYGGSHPTTHKSSIPLASAIINTLGSIDAVSFIVDRESLFVEEWCVDKVVNPKRIIAHFGRTQVQSVTFERGVDAETICEFVKLAGDVKNIASADRIEALLRGAGHAGVRLNYVRYGRITSDQKVIHSDAVVVGQTPASDTVLRAPAPSGQPGETVARTALGELEGILSLKQLLENPQEVSSQVSQALVNSAGVSQAANSLSQLGTAIRDLPDGGVNLPTIEALLHAVYELKMDLQEAIAVQKETGRIIASADPVNHELSRVTCEVIVKLVREEYRGGEISVKRLAHIIRRMLPDISELKELLPHIKTSLLADGMSLSEYLQLIKELRVELESEGLADVLRDAAEQLGTGVDEVVAAIRSEPADAARLLMLASEIRSGMQQNESQLSNFLTDYIEKASTTMALSSREIGGPDGAKMLRKIVARVESELVERLKIQGVDDHLISDVKQKLAGRFNTAFASVATQWMVSVVSTDRETPLSEVVPLLEGLVEQDGQLKAMRDPLTAALAARGHTPAEIEAFFADTAKRVAEGKVLFELPTGILSTNNILFFLNREIKQHLRYKSPFSTLMVTVEKIHCEGGSRAPSKEDLALVMPPVYGLAKGMLRDLDLIGSPGKLESNTVFVILTMTPETGAIVVRDRLYRKIGDLSVVCPDGTSMSVEARISVAAPNADTIDMRLFMDLVKKCHREECTVRPQAGNAP